MGRRVPARPSLLPTEPGHPFLADNRLIPTTKGAARQMLQIEELEVLSWHGTQWRVSEGLDRPLVGMHRKGKRSRVLCAVGAHRGSRW